MVERIDAKKVPMESMSVGSEGRMVPLQSVLDKKDVPCHECMLSGVGVDDGLSLFVWAYIRVRVEQAREMVTLNDLRMVTQASNLENMLEQLINLRLIKRHDSGGGKMVYSTVSERVALIRKS